MKLRVLVFDDEEVIVQLVKQILIRKDIEVFGRQNCNNLADHIHEIKPDVILMDNEIPAIGGVKATQAIKNDPQLKNIPVIYFSAHDKIAELAKEAGADDHLAKPFDIPELERMVMKHIKTDNSTPKNDGI